MKTIYTTLFCVALAFAGCGDDHDHDHGDGPNPVTPVEVTNTLTMTDWQSGDPLEGINLCYAVEVADPSAEVKTFGDCVTTDAEGKGTFTALVANGDKVELRGDKENYFPFLSQSILVDPEAGNYEADWVMASTDGLGLLTSLLDAELDDAKGQATLVIVGPADAEGDRPFVTGATVEINGNAEFGPEYVSPQEDFLAGEAFGDPANGTTATGLAAFFNVDAGVIDLTVTAEGHVCEPGVAGLPSEQGTVSGLIEAGRVTYFTVRCELAP